MKELYGMRRLAGRLGLAREATALLRGDSGTELPGIREDVREERGVEVHTVTVLNEAGSSLIGRPTGRYVTCTLPGEREAEDRAVMAVLARVIGGLLPPGAADGPLLLVGLGNRQATPDALGPAVIDRSYATAHAFRQGEEPAGWGQVCTLAPGVLGTTGMDTVELVAGVCSRLRPATVIAVDALAAAEVSRVGLTVQLSDSGIRPGSGVGGAGGELTAAALGCPLLALGVPTVVDTAAIIGGTLSALREHWESRSRPLPPELDDAAREYAEERLLSAFHGRLLVTPREIDDLIDRMAQVLAGAVALAVHPGCREENVRDFIK
ncbi:MAG: GPR endopeptidase [Firmicutes bacterium]|nr:GPR endopeptidase [Bacillota bacterium]